MAFLFSKVYTPGTHTGCNKYMLKDIYTYIHTLIYEYVYISICVYKCIYTRLQFVFMQTKLNVMEISELLYDFLMYTQFSFTYLVN